MAKQHKPPTDWKGFPVQSKMCASCIYRRDSPFNTNELEAAVKDKYVGFHGYRACHHVRKKIGGLKVCCSGFWKRHKGEFPAGQIAQRLNCINFVQIDELN